IAAASGTYLISAIQLAGLPAAVPPRQELQTFLRDLRHGWSEVRSRTWVWVTVVLSSLANLFLAAFLVLGPVVAKQSLDGPSSWATIMAVLGVGSLAGGIIALRIRPDHPLRIGIPLVSLCALPTLTLASHQGRQAGGHLRIR
ncbi:MAG: hypothetical protein JWO67_6337, partial [Streptosporangiaceae bacterium]|nr:hypothetical protein [Streptosporangiaceae bacterium]